MAATYTKQEYAIASAEQAGLRGLCLPKTRVTQHNAKERQIDLLLTSDIIYHAFDFSSFSTDANIDESCYRTLHGSNRVVCVGKSISTIYN